MARQSLLRNKGKSILTLEDLQQVAESDSPFIQVQTNPPGNNEPQQVFLDTSLQQMLYGDPIGEPPDSPSSNLSTVWIITPPQPGGVISGPGPYIFSNVTTPIGQVQPSTEPTGIGRHDINVLPVSTNFVWNAEPRAGMWALYYQERGTPEQNRLYALPEKSDDPNLTPPRDTLIKAVRTDPRQQDVFVFTFNWADSIKYNPSMPSGIDVYLRQPGT